MKLTVDVNGWARQSTNMYQHVTAEDLRPACCHASVGSPRQSYFSVWTLFLYCRYSCSPCLLFFAIMFLSFVVWCELSTYLLTPLWHVVVVPIPCTGVHCRCKQRWRYYCRYRFSPRLVWAMLSILYCSSITKVPDTGLPQNVFFCFIAGGGYRGCCRYSYCALP